jgi:hypothetical protein
MRAMRGRWRLLLGIAMALCGVAATIAGAALLATVGVDGVYRMRSRIATDGRAIVFDALSVGSLPVGDVRLAVEVTSERPVFVGIAPGAEVEGALDGVAYARIVRLDPGRPAELEDVLGSGDLPDPAGAAAWVASDEGPDAAIEWTVAPGSWALAIMDAEGEPGLDVIGDVSLTVPYVGPLGVVLVSVGVALLVGGGALAVVAMKRAA